MPRKARTGKPKAKPQSAQKKELENKKQVGASSQVLKVTDLKLLYINADRKSLKDQAQVTQFLKQENADVIVVIEAHDVQQNADKDCLLKELKKSGAIWNNKLALFGEKQDDKILCLYNETKLGKEDGQVQFHENDKGKFLSMRVKIENSHGAQKNLNIMMVHLPHKNDTGATKAATGDKQEQSHSTAKEKAWEEVELWWKDNSTENPAIALGDFNRETRKVAESLQHGTPAFVYGQLPTNSDKKLNCIDNAFANNHCDLVSFRGEKIEGLSHKVFSVRYKIGSSVSTYPEQ